MQPKRVEEPSSPVLVALSPSVFSDSESIKIVVEISRFRILCGARTTVGDLIYGGLPTYNCFKGGKSGSDYLCCLKARMLWRRRWCDARSLVPWGHGYFLGLSASRERGAQDQTVILVLGNYSTRSRDGVRLSRGFLKPASVHGSGLSVLGKALSITGVPRMIGIGGLEEAGKMPRRPFQSGEVLHPSAHYARRIKQYLRAFGIKRADFVAKSNGAIKPGEFDKVLASDDAGKRYHRRYVRQAMLEATVRITKLPAPFWTGGDELQSAFQEWLVARHPEYAEQFWNVVSTVQPSAGELIGWGSIIPCSLMPLDFMRAHHESLAHDLYDPGLERDHYVATFNDRGEKRHKALREVGFERPWDFIHIMFADDLRNIAAGKAEYARIPVQLRRKCILELLGFVQEPRWRVQLFIVDRARSEEAATLRVRLAGTNDSVVVLHGPRLEENSLLFMRRWDGTIKWTMAKSEVRTHLSLLERLKALARPYPHGTLRFLKTIRGGRDE